MNELKLIKLLCSYNNYITYRDLVDTKSLKDNIKELYYITLCMFELLEKLKHNITIDELQGFFYAKYPDAAKETYAALFDQLSVLDVSEDVGHEILAAMSRNKVALQLAEKAYSFTQGFASLEELGELSAKLLVKTVEQADDTEYVTTDLDILLSDVVTTHGLRWRLDCLNKSLGSLRQGDFGFIFARPETGKTTFLASEIANMLDQTDKQIIWFNNEEQGKKVMLRIYQAYFGVELQTLIANASLYKAKFQSQVGEKFRLVDDASLTRSLVEKVLAASSGVGLILADQLDKVKGFDADRDDLRYGAIYQWARELAKSYGPFIGVSQADGTAEGQRWLTMQHVANAKTSKQAEADFICGIGKTHDPNAENIRFLNISKNKLTGDIDSIAELRHGRFETLIQPQIARYKDLISYD